MSPPWASTKALAMASPRPALPPPPVLAEHLEDALAILGRDARALVAHRDLHLGGTQPLRHQPPRCLASRCRRHGRADTTMALCSARPVRVLEHVGQHLADQHMVDVQEGQVVGCLGDDAVRRDEVAQGAKGLGDELVERNRAGPDLERTRLDAGHVEQVGDEPGQTVRLQLDELQQLGPVLAPATAHRTGAGWTPPS